MNLYQGQDDMPLFVYRRDISGGLNNRLNGNIIGDTQSTVLLNVDIGTPGESRKRPGNTLLHDLGDADAGLGAFGFMPDASVNYTTKTPELLVVHGVKVEGITNFTTGAETTHHTMGTTGLLTTILQAFVTGGNGSVVLISNGTDNVHQMLQDYTVTDLGNGTDDPPLTTVMEFYRGILFCLKNNQLFFSSAYPSGTFAGAISATTFAINCGDERFLLGTRDTGLIIGGKDSIWGLNPSTTPVATDIPEKILDFGCASGRTACQVGDDVMFLSHDGVRGLFRTTLDKLQANQAEPISFQIKDEVDSLNWAQISKACAVYWDNKYFLSVPVDSSTTNNEVWVYYPSLKAWMVIQGWNVGAWAKIKVSGQERLYYIDSAIDKVYRAWTGYTDSLRTFTATQALTTITSTVGTFEAGDKGKTIIWADGTQSIVDTVTDANNVESTVSETKSEQACYIGYINYQEEGRKEDLGQPLKKKNGGEVKIKALSIGNYNLTVSASIDDETYTILGTMNLYGAAPVLPVTLPFTLAIPNIVEEQFHLDSLGPWNTLRIKIQHNAANGSDDIKVYERQIISFPEEYLSE